MRYKELKESLQDDIIDETMWWVQRWVSGSMTDPDWDESWLEHVHTFDKAMNIFASTFPSKEDKTLYRYLALSDEDYNSIKHDKTLKSSKPQSFTTDMETAEKIAIDLNRPNKNQVILTCAVKKEDILLDIGAMFHDKKTKRYMMSLLDWMDQKEVLVKPNTILKVINIKKL